MSDELKFELPTRPAPRARGRLLSGILVLLIGAAVGFFVRPVVKTCSYTTAATPSAGASLLSRAELTSLAETLEKNQLYGEAARAWQRAAKLAPAEVGDKAELLFRIGKNLSLAGEHEQALSYLFAAEAADSDGKFSASINKLVLEGLSALGREDVRAYQAGRRVALAPSGDDGPAKVAEIGGEPITQVDLQSFARRLVTERMAMQQRSMSPEEYEKAIESQLDQFKKPEGRRQVLQIYLSQELLYREALAAKMPDRDDVRQRITDARRGLLVEAFVQDYLSRSLHIGENDLQDAYDAHKTEYLEPAAVKVEAIVVETQDAKKEVSAALDNKADFAEMREKFSTLKPGPDSPDPFDRWITRDGYVPMVSDGKTALAHLFSLEAGEISKKWFEGTGGKWLRFRLAKRRDERQLALAECRDRVEGDLRGRRQDDLLKQLQESLRSKYKVVVHEEKAPTSQPQDKGL